MKKLFAVALCLVSLVFMASGWSSAGEEQVIKSLLEGRSGSNCRAFAFIPNAGSYRA